jgi:ABC-type branched-subunit amino acid transport system substrate-binding protein
VLWLTADQSALRDQTAEELLEAMETHMSTSGTWPGGDVVDKVAFREAFKLIQSRDELNDYVMACYDAVWSAAIGIAAAAAAKGNSSDGQPVSGGAVMDLMRTGKFPEFQGAWGRRNFLSNGDTDLNHTRIEISNYGRPPGAERARHAVIARIDLQTNAVTMLSDEKAVWGNGRQYPYVSLALFLPSPF